MREALIKIYALYRRKEVGPEFFIDDVVYVGRTKNIKQRMSKHKKQKEFDAYKILDTTDDLGKSKILEDHYIRCYNPIYNRSLNATGNYLKMNEILEKLQLEEGDYADFIHQCIVRIKPVFEDNYNLLQVERAYMYSKYGCY